MLEAYGIYIIAGFLLIAFFLLWHQWGNVLYSVTKHRKMVVFLMVASFLGTGLVIKQEQFKYELAYYYYTGSKNVDEKEMQFRVRQCKEFITAKLDGRRDVPEYRPVSAGPLTISSVNNWEFCARTFGLSYWKIDTSINGQDGGRVLCDAYARDTYRSTRVNTWCDTVFAPAASTPGDRKT